MLEELDAHSDAVLAYPETLRIDGYGALVDKEPRVFDTSGVVEARDRWRRFCWNGFGSGDMVYGLMRVRALVASGIFRPVLNPDRLLDRRAVATGRDPAGAGAALVPAAIGRRKRCASEGLAFAGPLPPRFDWPPSLQHAVVLRREGFTLPMIGTVRHCVRLAGDPQDRDVEECRPRR